ncbi:MAG: helix-turn-helix transcriptional regulator [Faecalimonas sp.]|nr:helix-turn-helix transcriptional regulator [Faecalimonas sp.]
MYKNKCENGSNNICGPKICYLRKQMYPKVSQRAFADQLQLRGLDLDKNAIQRIECGKRFVTDIELKIFAQVLNTTTDNLLDTSNVPYLS